MKLDKTVEPLATDTTIKVRPRSALGLKYVELTPGKGKSEYTAGDTVPLRNATEGLELEDVFSTLDEETRENSRLAGGLRRRVRRARQLDQLRDPGAQPVLQEPAAGDDQPQRPRHPARPVLPPARPHVGPGRPVASVQADLFSNMATTFEAISRDPGALQATIEKSPSTLDASISSFRVQRPFLADFADLSRRLHPAVNELPRSLPAINRAFRVGTPILPRTVDLNNRTRRALLELEDLFENPNTLLTIRDLQTTLAVTRPALEFVAPYQTVCNYFNYFFHPLGEHQCRGARRHRPGAGLKTVNNEQANTSAASRPPALGRAARRRPDRRRGAGDEARPPYATPYQPAIDAQGNADCQNGQDGFVRGPARAALRYQPGPPPDGTPTGGNGGVLINDFPILSGGTFKSRELGIEQPPRRGQAAMRRTGASKPQHQGMSPFTAGLIAVDPDRGRHMLGFTKFNPFANPYKLTAVFETANNLKPNSPVRIAGVDVGKVKKVEAIGPAERRRGARGDGDQGGGAARSTRTPS